jgi:hypothetical protein
MCTTINTQNSSINAGTAGISGGSFTGTTLSTGTGSISGGAGNFSGDLSVGGNLNVSGRVDFVNSSELLVADKHITLASTSNATDALASGAGIYVHGSNYATSNSSISLTWNTGCNGNYWMHKGGNLAISGTSNSKMVTLSTAVDGSLKLLSDDGSSSTSTAVFGTALIASSSNLDIGTTSNVWGNIYAISLGTTSNPTPLIFSGTVMTSDLGASGSIVSAGGISS